MSAPRVNGELHASITLDHLLQYPAVNDGVKAFKQNYYGQRSLSIVDRAYQTFAAPVLPYFAKPYSYVQPYVRKADEVGEHALNRFVDERFPAIRNKPAAELYTDAKSLIFLPYNLGVEGRDHVLEIYHVECKKQGNTGDNVESASQENGGAAGKEIAPVIAGVVVYSKALVSTALIVTGETVDVITRFVNAKKEQAREATQEQTEKDNKQNNANSNPNNH